MASRKSRSSREQQAPDPASSYERAKPEKESGMGRLDNDVTTPTPRPDRPHRAVRNRNRGNRQINAHDVTDDRKHVDHSMLDEEPLGEDLTPTEAKPPEQRRHPRTEGKGGTR